MSSLTCKCCHLTHDRNVILQRTWDLYKNRHRRKLQDYVRSALNGFFENRKVPIENVHGRPNWLVHALQEEGK